MPVLTVAIAVAIGIALLLRKARFQYERLPKIPYVAGAQLAEVSIIVPARNAEADIERVLRSFPADMVIVVDERSEDRTAEIAREMDVRVVAAAESACLTGAQATEAEWLLIVDARTHYAPVFLPSLMQYAADENLEMVSVILGQETNTLAEKILLPFALALRFTGETGREWLANGPCLLVKRLVYLQLGGLATVDIPACGVRARVTRAEHMGSVCPRGFQPIRFSRANVLGGVQVVLAALLLASWLPMLALLIQSGYARQAMIFGLLPAVILFPWYRGPASLLAPVAIYLFLWKSLTGRAADNAARPVQNGTRTSA